MKKLYFLLLLILCVSCKMNRSPDVENIEAEEMKLDETEYDDQSEGKLILDKLGKVYGNDSHISGLTLESPNCPDFIEGFYFDKSQLVFQVTGDTVKVRRELEKAAGSSSFRLEPIDDKNYSQKKLLAINQELIRRFEIIENESVKRNISGFGVGLNYIEINLIFNTPEKRKEFREKIMNSPAFRFKGPEVPVIDEEVGVSDTLGISIRSEHPIYPIESEELTFILNNNSGIQIECGAHYHITFEDEKGIWRRLPMNNFFNDIGYIVKDKGQRVLKAPLYPDVYPNSEGRYRYFYKVRAAGKLILMMAEFRLSSDEIELKMSRE